MKKSPVLPAWNQKEKQEVMIMKIKRLTVALMTAVVLTTTPVSVMASAESQTEEIIMDNVDTLLSDPDKVVDIVVYVKDLIDQQQITGDQIAKGVDMASETLGISLTDEEKKSLVDVAQKVMDINIDEDQLRSYVSKVYDKMESVGLGKEEVKGLLQKMIDFAKSILD